MNGEILTRIQFCSCGEPDTPLKVLKEALELLWLSDDFGPARDQEWRDRWGRIEAWLKPDESVRWFVLYCLDAWGLTEHGGSIGGAWLTDDGKELLMFLRETGCSKDKWNEAEEAWANRDTSVKTIQ